MTFKRKELIALLKAAELLSFCQAYAIDIRRIMEAAGAASVIPHPGILMPFVPGSTSAKVFGYLIERGASTLEEISFDLDLELGTALIALDLLVNEGRAMVLGGKVFPV